MPADAFIRQIREHIAANELPAALQQLRILLEHSPKLDEAILQSGRFHDIRRQIRLGTVSPADAKLTQDEIREGLLDLLREVEESVGTAQKPQNNAELRQEVEHAISIIGSKNLLVNSKVEVGGNFHVGDITNQFITYSNEHKIPRGLTTPPFNPPVFIGRDPEMQELRDRLLSGQDLLLLVNGQGGMGKTSVASRYWLQFQDEYTHLAFLYVGDGIAGPMLRMAPELGLEFDREMPEAERFPLLLQKLANLKARCLLVLDNANDDDELEKYFQALHKLPNFHLIITSRLADFQETQSMALGALPEDYPLELFKTHYTKHRTEDDALFWGIFEAVGGNTLVIEVLAKNLREINQNEEFYPLPKLLEDLQSRNLLHLSGQSLIKVQWQDMEKATPEEILAAMFDLRPLPPEALRLLSNFAVLPPENIDYSMLKTLLQPEDARLFSDTLTMLYRTGWIEKSEMGKEILYKCSPVVQEVVRSKSSDIVEDCQLLVDTLTEKLDYETGTGHFLNATYEEALHFARYGEGVTTAISQPSHNTSILLERIGNYHITVGNIEKGFFFFEKKTQNSKALCDAYPDNPDFKNSLAISYSKLGSTHSALGNLDRALTYFEQYNQLEKELYDAFPQKVSFKNSLAISYSKLGETHSALGNLDRALTYFEQYNQLEKELYDAYPQNVSFKNGLAISYSKLGSTHSALGNLDRALTYFEQYNQLEKELYEAYPQNVEFKNNLAISYEKLGSTHSALGNLDRALTYFEDETRLFEELYEAYPQNVSFKNGLAISYYKLGQLYEEKGDLQKAFEYFEQDLKLTELTFQSSPSNAQYRRYLQISYDQMREISEKLGKKDLAAKYGEKAKALEQGQ